MKSLKVTVNGITYDVLVEEINESDNLKNESNNIQVKNGGSETSAGKDDRVFMGEEVKAPMPGTVVSVNVNEMQSVKKGDVLLILEAMKMENEITAPRDAVVSGINVKKGETVDTGAALIFLK